MKSYLTFSLLTAAALLVGCASKKPVPPPTNPVVTPAPYAPSAKQPVRDARSLSAAASERTASARSRVGDTQAAVTGYRDQEYTELKGLVTRLVEQDAASTEELQDVYTRVFGAEVRIDNLLGRLGLVQEDLEEEKSLRLQADEKLVEASEKIAAKDAEAAQLRQQFKDQQQTIEVYEENAKKNFEAALKAEKEAERIKGQRDLVIKILIGVSILALISLVVNYVQFRSRSVLGF